MVFFTIWVSQTLLPQSSTNTEASRLHPSGPCSNGKRPPAQEKDVTWWGGVGGVDQGLKESGTQKLFRRAAYISTWTHIQSWPDQPIKSMNDCNRLLFWIQGLEPTGSVDVPQSFTYIQGNVNLMLAWCQASLNSLLQHWKVHLLKYLWF